MAKYFDNSEFACKCGNHNGLDHWIDPDLLAVLDVVRERLGVPVYVLSGYRCPTHNAEVGGVPNSQHVEGTAADITYDDIDVEYLADVVEGAMNDLGLEGGIGKYYHQDFVHVDTRGYVARWDDL